MLETLLSLPGAPDLSWLGDNLNLKDVRVGTALEFYVGPLWRQLHKCGSEFQVHYQDAEGTYHIESYDSLGEACARIFIRNGSVPKVEPFVPLRDAVTGKVVVCY